MKNSIKLVALLAIATLTFNSCEKDSGTLPTISFKAGSAYVSTDVTKAVGSSILFGIDAAKSEKRDVLKKFDVSISVNGGTAVSVFTKDLTGNEQDNYSYEYSTLAGSVAGQTCKYTFTVTNRDGLVNQIFSTVTAQ